MTKISLRKLQFLAFLVIATFMELEESWAYKISCPVPSEIKTQIEGTKAYVYGEAKNESAAPFRILSGSEETLAQKIIDPKSMKFYGIDIHNGMLFCGYGSPSYFGILFLRGNLPTGANCQQPAAKDTYINCQ